MRFNFLVLNFSFWLFIPNLFSQENVEYHKEQFFQLDRIGSDSALFHVEKIFQSKRPIDLAFAYSAKRQLLFLTGVEYNDLDYLQKIESNLEKLENESQHFKEVARIYNINANTFFNKKQNKEALEYYFKALSFASKCNDVKLIVKVKSNIVVIKGDKGLEKEAIHDLFSLREVLFSNREVYTDEEFEYQLYLNNVNLGVYYANLFEKESNISYYNNSKKYLEYALKSTNSDDLIRANVYSHLGSLYSRANQVESSIKYYKKAIKIYEKNDFVNEVYYLKKNIAIDYYESGQIQLAKTIFAENVAKYDEKIIPEDYYLYNLLYLSKIYEDEEQIDSMAYYSNLFHKFYDKKNAKQKYEFAEVLSKIKQNDIDNLKLRVIDLKKNESKSTLIYIVLSVIVVILTFLIWRQVKLKKLNEKKFNDLISSVKDNISNPSERNENLNRVKDDKEKEIIKQLIFLEATNYFLRKDFDRYNVARKIGTNTTYLTQALKSYKNLSFNDYTNELRINYALTKLYEDSKLRGYTMQAIAESLGYKNGISFSKIFKDKTGITPYQYIERINRELLQKRS